jgi:site-specific DNA-methyltransferase (adenine-specific)
MEINKIIQGDCLVEMQKIPDKSIDMILCDLPYGTTACKRDTIIPFEPLREQYKRIIKDNGAIVLTASQPFTSALVMSNIKMFKYELIWHKTTSGSFATALKMPMKFHENMNNV